MLKLLLLTYAWPAPINQFKTFLKNKTYSIIHQKKFINIVGRKIWVYLIWGSASAAKRVPKYRCDITTKKGPNLRGYEGQR